MDRIGLFRIFARVVEAASFTHAAETLGMPRSSVSAAVQQLESRVGARLLTRTTRTVTPTPDGAAFYEHCLRLVADVEEAENLFRQSESAVQGVLRVNMPGRIGRLIVAPALPDFLATYPGLSVELGVTDRAVNLVEDGLDCVLRVGPLQDSGLIARRMGELELINVASPTYLKQHGIPQCPTDLLKGHEAVRYASPQNGRVEQWEWEEHGQTHTLDVPGRVTVNSAEALIACTLAGLGVMQIPAYDVRSYLHTGQLVEILPQWRAAPLPMALLYPHRRHLSMRVQVFATWLEDLVRQQVLRPVSPMP